MHYLYYGKHDCQNTVLYIATCYCLLALSVFVAYAPAQKYLAELTNSSQLAYSLPLPFVPFLNNSNILTESFAVLIGNIS